MGYSLWSNSLESLEEQDDGIFNNNIASPHEIKEKILNFAMAIYDTMRGQWHSVRADLLANIGIKQDQRCKIFMEPPYELKS